MRIFVLLFNARTENEGIHTIQAGSRNRVLMFESEDDATRFSLMLEAQDFPTPTIESMDSEEVEEFCQSAGYECQLVKEGMLVVPPEQNVEKLDWETKQHETDSDLSNEELEQIRRRLEGLL